MARSGGAVGGPSTSMRSPPLSFSEGLAAAWFTSTLPATMSCCTRARLTSGSCDTRNWSNRRPACADETSKVKVGVSTAMAATLSHVGVKFPEAGAPHLATHKRVDLIESCETKCGDVCGMSKFPTFARALFEMAGSLHGCRQMWGSRWQRFVGHALR